MSDIVVKFRPDGHTKLIEAIKRLNTATGGYRKTTDSATKGGRKFSDQIGRNRKAMSLFENSLATIRSRLLIYNFLMGVGVTQMVRMAQQSARLQNMERSFANLTKSAGSASTQISKLSAATKGTVSNFDLLQQANNAMILGVTKNSDEMANMFGMAKRLGDALGVDTTRAVESLITGIGRQSRLMLDNIGIIVKSEDAYKDYAASLDKTVDQLTDSEKKQAFFNAAMDAANKKVKQLGPNTKQLSDQFAQFGATMTNLGQNISSSIAPALGAMAETISNFINDLSKTDLEKARDDLIEIGVAAKDIALLNRAIDLEKATDRFVDSTRTLTNSFGNFRDVTELPLNLEELKNLGFVVQTSSKEVEDSVAKIGVALGTGNEEIRDFALGQELAGMSSGFATQMLKGSTKIIETNTVALQNFTGVNENVSASIEQMVKKGGELTTELANLKIKTKDLSDEEKKRKAELLNEIDINTEKLKFLRNLLQLLSIREQSEKDMNRLRGEGNQLDEDGNKIDERAVELKNILTETFAKSKTARADNLKTILDDIDSRKDSLDLDGKQIAALKILQAEYDKLTGVSTESTNIQLKNVSALAKGLSSLVGSNKANALESARLSQIAAIIDTYAAVNKTFKDGGGLNPATFVAASAILAQGLANVAIIESQLSKMGGSGSGSSGGVYGSFEHGGYVGGNRHSQGGTIIEAERGEFVMSRNAVESIGLETLNQMNQSGGGGNINVSVTGNVLTQDFVEGELAESIKEAVRRGSDFGIG